MTLLCTVLIVVALCAGACCLACDVELVWAPEGAEGLVLRGRQMSPTRLSLGEWGPAQGSGPVWPAPRERVQKQDAHEPQNPDEAPAGAFAGSPEASVGASHRAG